MYDPIEVSQSLIELQAGSRWQEVGSPGLTTAGGFISEAYNRELDWPSVAPLYNRLWRSDPELAIVRLVFEAWSGQQSLTAEVPEDVPGKDLGPPTSDDLKARDFYQSVLDDLEGGANQWLTACVTRVPFYGWGWWEMVPGVRDPQWKPPGDDPWRSDYDDGLVGFRRLAFRRYSSFYSWEIDDSSGRWTGMMQNDPPNPPVTIPLSRSVHVLFGDSDNPEGLATLEAVWRLERYKYALELVQGIGYEHAAGHSKFVSEQKLSSEDNTLIRKAARAVATAQEGNYIALPKHLSFTFEDVNFAAATSILEAIRYYSVLKLAVWGQQWVAMATLANTGAYSAVQDASTNALNIYNSMTEGFTRQLDDQLGRRLFDYPANRAAFPGMTRRPTLTISPVRKGVPLSELSQLVTALAAVLPLSDDDANAIRLETGFLPQKQDEVGAEQEEAVEEPDPGETDEEIDESVDEEGAPEEEDGDPEEDAEMMYLAENHDGVMVALYVPPEQADELALPGGDGVLGPQELHITLAYLGTTSEQAIDKRRVLSQMQRLASSLPEVSGRVNGHGVFTETHIDGKQAVWLSVDAPDLPQVRQMVVEELERCGCSVAKDHGFTPHITLAYVEAGKQVKVSLPEAVPVVFDKLWVAWGNSAYGFQLLGEETPADLAHRPFMVSEKEQPAVIEHEAEVTDADINRAMRRFRKWAEKNEPDLAGLLDAKVIDGDRS